MFLYDAENTEKILNTSGPPGTTDSGLKYFDPYNPAVKNINSIKFQTIYRPNVKLGFDDKNATIDFYNVKFIPDRHKHNKNVKKSVAIICEKNPNNEGERLLYFRSCVNGNVQESNGKVLVPLDFLVTKNKNYNYKIGNLFHNFSDVILKNFKILGKLYFQERRNRLKPDGYSNREEYLPIPMIDKMLKNYQRGRDGKNQYSTVSELIKTKIIDDEENNLKEMNIIKFLDTTNDTRDYTPVDGNFVKYEKHKSRGLSELLSDNNSNRDTIIKDLIYAPKLPINP